ncbi:MAG: hypothetical protein R2851_03985 [Caldilineaceae bacterium]
MLPNGKRIKGYGTTSGRRDMMQEDWTALFNLLAADGHPTPTIARPSRCLTPSKHTGCWKAARSQATSCCSPPEVM